MPFIDEHIQEVDTLDLKPLAAGKMHTLALKLLTDGLGSPVYIPVLVCKGAQDGPVLGLTAAVHGNELNGLDVIHTLFNEILTPETQTGTVVGIPGVNVPSLLTQERFFIDGMDLNRLFPGKPNGNRSEIYANRFVTRALPQLDYLIDLHTASFGRINSLYIRANLKHEETREISELLNAEILVHNEAKDGTLRDAAEDLYDIKAITLEVGNPITFQERIVQRSLNGIRRVMHHLGMQGLPAEFAAPDGPEAVYCKRSYWIYTDEGGVLEVYPRLCQHVKKGEHIANLRDLYGRSIKDYYAPEDGVVVGKSVNPLGPAGARILHLGVKG